MLDVLKRDPVVLASLAKRRGWLRGNSDRFAITVTFNDTDIMVYPPLGDDAPTDVSITHIVPVDPKRTTADELAKLLADQLREVANMIEGEPRLGQRRLGSDRPID